MAINERGANYFKHRRAGLVTTIGVLEIILTILIIQMVLLLLLGTHINYPKVHGKLGNGSFRLLICLLTVRLIMNVIGLIGGIKILKQRSLGRILILISCFVELSLFFPSLALYTAQEAAIMGGPGPILIYFNVGVLTWNIIAIVILFQKRVIDNLR